MKSALESSEEHIRLLGIITARWATLDTLLMELVAKLIGDQMNALSIYFSSASQNLRFDQINALLYSSKLVGEDKKEEYKKIIKRLSRLSRKRNQIVHCYATKKYVPNMQGIVNRAMRPENYEEKYQALQHKPAQGKLHEEIPLTTKFLGEHIDALSDAADDLAILLFPSIADLQD